MKLNELNNTLIQFLDKCEFNIKDIDGLSAKIENSKTIFSELKKLQELDLFDLNDFKLLTEMNNIGINNNLQNLNLNPNMISRWKGLLNDIRSKVSTISRILSKITREENQYQFNIKLSSKIKYMDDYFKFNNLICELTKDIQAISLENQAVCKLKFNGFEKGSDYIQFIVEAINGTNIDELYAYLNNLISIAKEFIIIKGLYLGNEWVKEKIRLTRAQANLTEKEVQEKEIDNQLRHNFIEQKLSDAKDGLTEKIEEKLSEKIILKLIEIIEQQNEIIPSLNAPTYITQDEKNIINYEKLKEIVEANNKPKQLVSDISEQKKE